MSDLFINTTVYFIFAAIVYIAAVIFFIMLISPRARKIAGEYLRKISKIITDQKFYGALKTNFVKYFTKPLGTALAIIFRFISNISVYLRKAEDLFTSRILPLVIEPVNIASLLVRKTYTDSQTVVITVMAGLIVAFISF